MNDGRIDEAAACVDRLERLARNPRLFVAIVSGRRCQDLQTRIGVETLHFIGLTLLLGVVLLVDLRVLGVLKGVSFPSLHRLLPWAALGFGLNIGTGMLFFVGIPGQYIHNPSFYWKIGLAMLAGANAVYFTFFDEPWSLGPGEDAPLTAKIAAVSAMGLWIGVMYCGSMLPFLGNSF